MTYGININDRDCDGVKLSMVYLRHVPQSADKIIRIRERMLRNGWEGRPVILMDAGDHHVALTGSHRLAAAQGLAGIIEALFLPELTEEECNAIEGTREDEELLEVLGKIAEDRDDMFYIIETMREEVKQNFEEAA